MKRINISRLVLFLTIAPAFYLQAQKADSIAVSFLPFKLTWENTPVNFTQNQHSISITAGPKTDMFRDPNVTYNTDNAPKLLFTPDPDFVITCTIQHAFTNKWDGGALVLKWDSLNWVKFCFEKDYTGAHRVVSVVTRGISDDCNSAEIKGEVVRYKIAKADNVITLYYAVGDGGWFLIRHFQVDLNQPVRIGFLAQSPTGKLCTVRFSDIVYTHKKIKDPYLGE
jgi:uncharacterized protein